MSHSPRVTYTSATCFFFGCRPCVRNLPSGRADPGPRPRATLAPGPWQSQAACVLTRIQDGPIWKKGQKSAHDALAHTENAESPPKKKHRNSRRSNLSKSTKKNLTFQKIAEDLIHPKPTENNINVQPASILSSRYYPTYGYIGPWTRQKYFM